MKKITVRQWLGNNNFAIYKIPQPRRWDLPLLEVLKHIAFLTASCFIIYWMLLKIAEYWK